MTVQAHEAEYPELTATYWMNITIAGLVAGLLMGIVMFRVMGIMQAVGSLYGFAATGPGWIAHLFHAVVFALIFGGFYMWAPLKVFRDRILASVTIGIIWGVVLWFLAAGVVMPLWLEAVSTTAPPALPSLNPVSGLGHVLYGAVLGGVAAALQKY